MSASSHCDSLIQIRERTRSSRSGFRTRDFHLAVCLQHGSTTAYATYTSVKEALTRNIQSTYKNGFEVADSLESMKVYDWDAVEPKRPISTIKEEDQRKVHQEGLDMQLSIKAFRGRLWHSGLRLGEIWTPYEVQTLARKSRLRAKNVATTSGKRSNWTFS